MISDNTLIKVLANRSIFYKYKKHIQQSALLEHTVQIIHDMGVWFDKFQSSEEITWDEFSEWFRVSLHPSYSEEESQLYATQFERIKEVEVNSILATDILKNLIERKYAKDLMELGVQVCHGDKEFNEAKYIFEECNNAVSKILLESSEGDQDKVTDDVVELLNDVYGDDGSGLDWPIEEMNISLGPLRKGDSVLIAAYVDTGKTLLTINCCRAFIHQIPKDQQIVYFANEESGKNVKLRFIQSVLGWTGKEMRDNFNSTLQEYNKSIKDPSRFVLYHNGMMDIHYVEDRIKRHNPGLIVIDQLHNLGGFEKRSTTNVERMTELAKWTRRLAQLAPCIFTHQADGQCNGVKFIELNQLYGSKVGIQGAVDAVVTLGKEHGGPQIEFERGLYFPKNKMLGGRRCVDEMRKNKWNINIKPNIARIEGLI